MAIELSCAFATSPESHEHARIAEALGYRRAFFFDSPALYPDVWVQLCRAAERTERIGLGPGVLIPSLRHPMTNAAAIATLAELAGAARVVVGVGSGFTGRMTMGQRAMRWRDVAAYVRTLRGLLRGEPVAWEGKPIQMLHTPGFAPPRPLEVPFIIAAGGPKGIAVAREVGDGVAGACRRVRLEHRPRLRDGAGRRGGGRCRAPVRRRWPRCCHAAALQRRVRPPGHAAAGAEPPVVVGLRGGPGRESPPGHALRAPSACQRVRSPLCDRGLLTQLGLARSAAGWRERLAQLEAAGP